MHILHIVRQIVNARYEPTQIGYLVRVDNLSRLERFAGDSKRVRVDALAVLPVLSLCIRNYLLICQFALLSGIEQLIVFSLLVLLDREQVTRLLVSEQDTKAFKLEKFWQYFPAVEKVIDEAALRWDDRRHSYRGDNFFLSSLLDNERVDLV